MAAFPDSVFRHFSLLLALSLALGGMAAAEEVSGDSKRYFVTDNGLDLRAFADKQSLEMLERVRGKGEVFGTSQRTRYCTLKSSGAPVQWVVNDLETGAVISRSANAEQLYFGASVSKLFVAAALLDKQKGKFSKSQLRELVKLIVVSDNPAWLSLQRQTGEDGSDDSGRAAVQAFVEHMGYPTIKGFQGWMERQDGTREHGNELNTLELAHFLSDTRHRKYQGADVIWEIMRATRTGENKIAKYTPEHIYLGGKTGTYSGINESPETIHLPTIKARNHAAILSIDDELFGISVLTNTGSNEDVAILGGGLMREYLGVKPDIGC
jgi:hypothetical protein